MKPLHFWQLAFFVMSWAAFDLGWAFLYFLGASIVGAILECINI